MAKLSVIIPSRDEKFLEPTIRDIFRNRRGECEVVAVLDSDKWPAGWRELVAEFPDLHTIHNGALIGMRGSINKGVASAKSRGAKFIMKTDGHCSFSEGFDVVLAADCDKDWVVVPRRGRLDPENWVATDTHKPDIDYHYLSFPDDPADFGGPGLNGKVWEARAAERKDVLIDEEMSSQGSCWFMHTDYFYALELMDEAAWGPFWAEFQEIGFHCWLSGGKVMVNKKAKYLHLHKGKKYGRGYRLAESALKMGRNQAMRFLYNEGWPKQTLPFKSLIERFWPVPGWADNWEELVYGNDRSKAFLVSDRVDALREVQEKRMDAMNADLKPSLKIHSAQYGISETDWVDVTAKVQELVTPDGTLDIVVNNSTLDVGNPYRGKKKRLKVVYTYDGGPSIGVERDEKEWLIIGQARGRVEQPLSIDAITGGSLITDNFAELTGQAGKDAAVDKTLNEVYALASKLAPAEVITGPMTATALNDHLIRKFRIPDRRLRGPMPIEVREFHRDDLAVLFAELGFTKGAEVGVAEGKYSEVLLKANPECELLLIDPWDAYDGNAQNKTQAKHEFAYSETLRRVGSYPNVHLWKQYSMDAVREVKDGLLDFVYLDANHSYPFIMEDLTAWSRKVRSGGIVALDDIYKLDEKRWGAGPMEAIYDYTRAMRINPWWLIAAHKSVDAFFVKP